MTSTHDRSFLLGCLATAGLLLAVLTSACAADPNFSTSPTTGAADPLSPDVAPLRLDDLDQAALAAVGADDPCACTTDACVSAWIEKELGCDVCVELQCEPQPIHGCNVCPEAQDDLPTPAPKDPPY